jgi:predicted ferric reductase
MGLRLGGSSVAVGGDDQRVGLAHPAQWSDGDVLQETAPYAPWFGRKAWGIFLAVTYPLLVVAPLAVLAALNPLSDHMLSAEVGVDCAVVGFTILALQFAITARLSWVEAPFGLDVLFVFHRAMALLATALLCVHPVLVASEEGWSLLGGGHVHWYVWVGRLALVVLLGQIVASLARRAIRLPYERWRHLHNGAALALLGLGCVHSLGAGEDMSGGGLLVWFALMAIAVGFWVYSHVVRRTLLLQHPCRVIGVEPEAPHVWTLTLELAEGRPFRFAPGQFQFLRLHGAEIASQEHPFTIASSPTQPGRIGLTIKESGDFTAGIGRVRLGDRATIQGPFGRFSYTLHRSDEDLVFVAGGVGITPLMSMLRFMRDRSEPRRVVLAYASRSAADMLFTSELGAMQARQRPALTVVPVLADPHPGWTGETGRLDAERVASLCGGIESKAFYLCCPPPMTAALVRGLRRLGVSPRRIHTDHFSL